MRGFMNLLDCQFPIASPKTVVALKTAADFADKLNIHTNHLNHCLKAHFGKSTSSLIQERIVAEAIELLRYSNWSIADIGYSLGFAYPQHFSSFLKRNSGYPPRYYRDMQMQNI